MKERNEGEGDARRKGGESPVREKRCWNAATEEEEERAEKGVRRGERSQAENGERRTSDEEAKKERIELLPTQRLSYLMIYSAVPESR